MGSGTAPSWEAERASRETEASREAASRDGGRAECDGGREGDFRAVGCVYGFRDTKEGRA